MEVAGLRQAWLTMRPEFLSGATILFCAWYLDAENLTGCRDWFYGHLALGGHITGGERHERGLSNDICNR
jgi:hypothetical protein